MTEHVIERKTSRVGRWLAAHRLQFALWIAALEGVIIAVSRDISWVVALIIAAPIILFYLVSGRSLQSDAGRQVAWIAGASQTFVVLLAILFKLIGLFFIILIGILSVIALVFLYADRPGRVARQ